MGMDKEISPEVKRRRKKILIIKFAFVACALVCFFIVLVKVFSAGIPLEDIDFGTVTKGCRLRSSSARGRRDICPGWRSSRNSSGCRCAPHEDRVP